MAEIAPPGYQHADIRSNQLSWQMIDVFAYLKLDYGFTAAIGGGWGKPKWECFEPRCRDWSSDSMYSFQDFLSFGFPSSLVEFFFAVQNVTLHLRIGPKDQYEEYRLRGQLTSLGLRLRF